MLVGNTEAARSDDGPRKLRQQIEARLRGVCSDWTEERFARLIDDVTRVSLKYDYNQDARGRQLADSDRPSSW
jgi:hypothetical protein